ncbi:MAG: hypothetical protein FWG98_02840 [Candidatus Cloacimonetes bacterium]|nr:hypothetical protein [Candidatus Cloacimonadota bacterium]
MNKDLGRLDFRDIKVYDEKMSKIFHLLDEGQTEKAKDIIIKMLTTPNYFIREFVGKKLVNYQNKELMDQLILSFLGHKVYGVRAAVIFYYNLKFNKDPEKIISLLELCWNDTPWETEHVLHEMWQKYPAIMKKEMMRWAKSEFNKQRTLAYHGIEAIAGSDPTYITTIIELNLDSDNLELQKKITNVLTHAVKGSPAECYSFIREWLTNPSETRIKTLYITMKKLVSIAIHNHTNNKSPKNDEFYLLTMQSIKDWKADPDKSISSMGEKLVSYVKNPGQREEN